MANRLKELNDAMADIVESVHNSLVQIHNGERGIGAGTIWHEQGLILTNAHVIEKRGYNHQLSVTLPDGRELPTQILEVDSQRDIAALYVEATDLPYIELGESQALKTGEWVFAVGHPWGVPNAVTSGIVIGLNPPPEMQLAHPDWIAVSLHMRPGHSGGPLVDNQGRLVGMNTFITGPDVGYAVPAHIIKRFLKDKLGSRVA